MRLILVGILLYLIAACDSPSVSATAAVVRDSSGVRIVENGPIEDLPTVQVQDNPSIRVGWTDDGPLFERVQTGFLRPGGGAVVGDGQSARVVILDTTGVATEVGRRGEGPGEFKSIGAVLRVPDERFLVWDYASSRLSLFDHGGTFLESQLVSFSGFIGMTPYGIMGSDVVGWVPTSPPPAVGGADAEWLTAPLLVSNLTNPELDTIHTVPIVYLEMDGDLPSADPFTRFGSGNVYDGGFVWGSNDRPEMRWIGPDGELTQVARWQQASTAVTDSVWREYERQTLVRGGYDPDQPIDERRAERFRVQRSAAAPVLPFFRWAVTTPSGAIWLSEYTMSAVPAQIFLELSSDGRPNRWIEFPRPIRVLDILGDQVLGVETNEWDVQAVVIYSVPG